MEKLFQWLEKTIILPMARLSEQRHLKAIRTGIGYSPIVVGSIFLIIAYPPIPISRNMFQISRKYFNTFRLTIGLMSLYTSWNCL